jgi:hypothetical protein
MASNEPDLTARGIAQYVEDLGLTWDAVEVNPAVASKARDAMDALRALVDAIDTMATDTDAFQ